MARTKLFIPHRLRDALGTIILPNGRITTDSEEMTSALSDHWGLSFRGSVTSAAAQEAFCADNVSRISPSLFSRPSCRDVAGTVRRGAWSAPGPDGLASGIWARFSSCVSWDFYRASVLLGNGGAIPVNFNSARAAYIPKKGLLTGIHGLQARPSEARPLVLKNASAKILLEGPCALLDASARSMGTRLTTRIYSRQGAWTRGT